MVTSEQTHRSNDLETARAAVLARYAPGTRVRRIDWSGGGTQVLELGDGPPLLLVHGAFAAASFWIPIFPALARTRRVLAVDLPGHGLADPFDYRSVDLFEQASTFLGDVLDALGLECVDLVGNSFGGFCSVAFALRVPERVSRLLLVGAPFGVTRGLPLPLLVMGLPGIGIPLARLMMSNPTRENTRKFWGQIVVAHPERVDDTVLDADVASTRRNLETDLSFIQAVRSLRGFGLGLRRDLMLGKRWLELETRTLYLCGDRDAFVSRRARRTWERILAENQHIGFVPVPDAGHLPWIDDPQRVVGEIERFLTTEDP
jgi:pimeloyl-ACP methyl ester carboxylesterase